jgi:hypothetical protein
MPTIKGQFYVDKRRLALNAEIWYTTVRKRMQTQYTHELDQSNLYTYVSVLKWVPIPPGSIHEEKLSISLALFICKKAAKGR